VVASFGAAGAAIDAALPRFIADGEAPGVAAGIVTAGGDIQTAAAGRADVATGRQMETDALLRIASITKLFTAIGIMQLRDEGILRLDDPLVAHLPEFAAASNPFGPLEDVTVRRLLMHESGLQSEHPVADPLATCWVSREEVLAGMRRVRVAIPPSSAKKYSNLGYDLLGEVVGRYGGGAWEDVIAARILEPLGMSATRRHPPAADRERVAVGHERERPPSVAARSGRGFVASAVQDDATMPGSGGLWSSVPDLLRFLGFVLRAWNSVDRGNRESEPGEPGLVLAAASVVEMMDCRLASGDVPQRFQGLGWYSAAAPSGRAWTGHTGLLHGFSARVLCSPADGVAVAVLANAVADVGSLAFELGEQAAVVADELTGRGGTMGEREVPPPAVLPFVGHYDDVAFGGTVDVAWEATPGPGRRTARLVLIEDGEVRSLDSTDDPLAWTVRGGRASGEPARFVLDSNGSVLQVNLAGFPYERRSKSPAALRAHPLAL
jgi:CubicO group peptidase (beta-lactamase class C family)